MWAPSYGKHPCKAVQNVEHVEDLDLRTGLAVRGPCPRIPYSVQHRERNRHPRRLD